MRISDWSSDVCSSDLEAGARRTLVGARQRLEVDVVDRAVVAVAIDQVDERIADALDGGDVQLHRPGRRLDHPGAHLAGAPAGRRRVLHPEGDGADRGTVQQGEGLGKALALGIEDEVHVALRSEEHTSELQSLMRISYAVFCLKKKKKN